jgi:hypothetical protein
MNTNIEVLRELDELVEAARLLGATQAKKLFGCHTDEDRRFERAMYESIDKHRAALLAEREALAAEVERLREALEGMEKWASSIYDGYPPSTASIAAAPYREAARAAIAKATGEVK